MLSAKLTEFFVKAERQSNYTPDSDVKMDLEILKVVDEIDTHVASGVDLHFAAQKAGLSDSTFSRRFAKMNGISFKRYMIEKKVQHAISLLKATDLKMVVVAFESGFDSVSGFYAAFKKVTGTTPNKFSESVFE